TPGGTERFQERETEKVWRFGAEFSMHNEMNGDGPSKDSGRESADKAPVTVAWQEAAAVYCLLYYIRELNSVDRNITLYYVVLEFEL
ncbi:hypothetical protein L195_g023972, partial [Trifolium pratense]